MSKTLTESEKRERLRDLMSGFDTAMLVTRTADGGLHSRPLTIADKRDDGALYFATAVESGKVHEMENNPQVNVSMQDKRKFVSVTGIARVVKRDRALIDKLWSSSWKIWFPQGKDDPSLCIVTVEPSEASYWDASGTEGVRYLFAMAKAYLTGTTPPTDDDERHTAHVKV